MEKGVLAPYSLVMYTMRHALEDEIPVLTDPSVAGWKVKFACAWLTHGAAKPLLRWAQENESYGNVEDETNTIGQGPLYNGPAIMCYQRWQFWLHRLQGLASPESGFSDDVRQAAVGAVKTMKEVEEKLRDVPYVRPNP